MHLNFDLDIVRNLAWIFPEVLITLRSVEAQIVSVNSVQLRICLSHGGWVAGWVAGWLCGLVLNIRISFSLLLSPIKNIPNIKKQTGKTKSISAEIIELRF